MGDEHVILVPKDHRSDLLTAEEGLRIQSDDCDTWVIPTMEERSMLLDFLRKEVEHNGSSKSGKFPRHHVVGTGMRIGYNKRGVFIHANHNKRYFGMTKSSAGVLLMQAAPEAVPLFQAGDKSDLLGSLASKVTMVSEEVRSQFLHACFEQADANKNGKLSRPELGSMMRKVMHTMSSKDVEELMDLADADHNHQIDYKEFVTWLHNSAPEKFTCSLQGHLASESDIVHATFRLWDKDGDGLVSDAALERMLSHSSVGLPLQGCKTLVQLLDATHDGKVDYEEFCDFLFHRK